MDRQTSSISDLSELVAFDFIMPSSQFDSAMDIFQLTGDRSDLAVSFLEGLLVGNLSLALPKDFKTDKWIFENYVEAQNRNRVYGGHWQWVGFPLVQIQEEDQPLLAPLWFWPIRLRSPQNQDSGWTLQNTDRPQPHPNPKLDHLFREKLGWDSVHPWHYEEEGKPLNMPKLSALVARLIEQMGIDSPSQSVSISPWSRTKSWDNNTAKASLIWTGIIGIFPPAFPTKQLTGENDERKATVLAKEHSFGFLSRDPWQETALQESRRHKGILIQGSCTSGKTALLQDVVVNALSNGERCLIISDRMEVLRDLQLDFIRQGMEKLMVFLPQEEDSALLLPMLKQAAKEKKKETFKANKYSQQLDYLLETKAHLDLAYRAANKAVLGPYTWTQLVGLYLGASRLESKALLGSQLNAQDFKLSFERYQTFSEQLSQSQILFEDLKTLNHPLTILNAGIFVHQDQEEAQAFIFSKIKAFSESGADLQYQYIVLQNDYGDRLLDTYEQFYRQFSDQITNFQNKIQSYQAQFGRDPLESTQTTLKLYASFSSKFKKTLAAKNDIVVSYQALEKFLQEHAFFQHDFLPHGERHLLQKLRHNLNELRQQLQLWREQLGKFVQEELIRLSSKTVHPDLPRQREVKDLENKLDLLVDELNDSGLLQLPLENKNLTLARRQRFLEEVLEKLDRLRHNMRDFDRFYAWQRYWFGLPGEARRIITAIVKVKPNDWSAAFSSWYLHHLLLQNADPNLPESPQELDGFVEGIRAWRSQLINQITDLWADRRTGLLQRLKKENRSVYDQLNSKKEQQKGIEHGLFLQLLPQFFPITLASPYTLASVFSHDDAYDCLIIDEAHTLTTDVLDVLITKANRTIIFNNPDFDQQRISAWSRKQAWATWTLKGNYENAAHTVQVEEVEGRYNARQKINDEEARSVLNFLNTIEETPQRTLPKVGIVCFTRAQRNLLIQYLERIKRQRLAGVEKIQQLERNGLGIYVPDELFGIQLDLLIVSCTFGRSGIGDQLTTDIQLLNEQYQTGLAKLLGSRARQSTILLHSIPEEDLVRLAKDRAITNVNSLAQWILSFKKSTQFPQGTKDLEPTMHPLAGEIAWYIADQVRTDRLAFQVPFQQSYLPMTIAPLGDDQARAIILNAYFAETPVTSYEWEYNQRVSLAAAGFLFHPVWSAVWWRRATEEAAAFSTMVNQAPEEEE